MKVFWDGMFKTFSFGVLALSLTLFLGACGGGGGGGGGGGTTTDANPKLSGTVATGSPLVGAEVVFRDAAGHTASVFTDANGTYELVPASSGLIPPLLAKVVYYDPDTNSMQTLFSYAGSGATTGNVTPFTSLIVETLLRVQEIDPAAAFEGDPLPGDPLPVIVIPSQAEMDLVQAVVRTLVSDILEAANLPADYDFMTTPFDATDPTSGFDSVLEGTNVALDDSGTISVTLDPNSTLAQDVEASGGSTAISLDTNDMVLTDELAPAAPGTLTLEPLETADLETKLLITWPAPAFNNGTALPLTDLAGYFVYRNSSTSTVPSTPIATVPGAIFVDPLGASPSGIYSYWVSAFDAIGNESPLSTMEFVDFGSTTATPDVTSPVEDFGFDSYSAFEHSIRLYWSKSSSIDVSTYSIFRNTTAISNLVAKIPADGPSSLISFTDSGLLHSTPYEYWIMATDAAGNESGKISSFVAFGNISTLTPTDDVLGTIDPPLNVSASETAAGQVTVSWDNYTSSTSTDVIGFYVLRNMSSFVNFSTSKIIGVAPGITKTSFIDANVLPSTTYNYGVVAFDAAGNVSALSGGDVSVSTQAAVNLAGYLAAAKAALENNDIGTAHTEYTNAYNADSTNLKANFGLAVTELATLIEDPAMITFFETYSAYAPTAEQFIYDLFTSTYEVYGSNVAPGTSYDCDEAAFDPEGNGYTKLSQPGGSSTIYNNYDYYLIKAPVFSEVFLSIQGIEMYGQCEGNTNFMGGVGSYPYGPYSQVDAVIGSGDFELYYGGYMIIKAEQATNVSIVIEPVPEIGYGTQQKVAIGSGDGDDEHSSADYAMKLLGEAKGIFDKLPKSDPSLLTKMKVAAKTMIDGPPDIQDIQTVAKDAIIPTLNSVISKLRFVQGKNFTFEVTPAMTGGSELYSTYLDDGEYYGLDALLSVVNTAMYIFTAYDLTVDLSLVDSDPLSILYNNADGSATNFFTLQPDGTTRMGNARTALQNAVAKFEIGYNYIFDEWGYEAYTSATGYTSMYDGVHYDCYEAAMRPTKDPGDNGMQLHQDERLSPYGYEEECDRFDFWAEDDEETRKVFDVAPMVLAGQVTHNRVATGGNVTSSITDGTTTVIMDEWYDLNEPDDTETITVNATKLFTAPLTRANLPAFGYDLQRDPTLSSTYETCVNAYIGPGWDDIQGTDDDDLIRCDMYPTSDVPDYTLNGINPAGKNIFPEFGGILYLDQAIPLSTATNIKDDALAANDGTDLYVVSEEWDYTYNQSRKTVFQIGTTGTVIGTPVSLEFANHTTTGVPVANAVNYINDVAWHGGALWASGSYNDVTGNGKDGVFAIDLVSGLVDATKQLTEPAPTPCGPSCTTYTNLGGIASDGTDLYVPMGSYNCDATGCGWDNHDDGIVKFNPTGLTELPATRDFPTDWAFKNLFYGGGYLWTEGGGEKLDATTGARVLEYGTMEEATTYLNSRLYYVGDYRIHTYVAP